MRKSKLLFQWIHKKHLIKFKIFSDLKTTTTKSLQIEIEENFFFPIKGSFQKPTAKNKLTGQLLNSLHFREEQGKNVYSLLFKAVLEIQASVMRQQKV